MMCIKQGLASLTLLNLYSRSVKKFSITYLRVVTLIRGFCLSSSHLFKAYSKAPEAFPYDINSLSYFPIILYYINHATCRSNHYIHHAPYEKLGERGQILSLYSCSDWQYRTASLCDHLCSQNPFTLKKIILLDILKISISVNLQFPTSSIICHDDSMGMHL